MIIGCTDLEVSELRERVDDDAKDDVQADGCDEDEEGKMEDDEESELHKSVLSWMADEVLHT